MREQSILSHFRRDQWIRNGPDDGDGWTVGHSGGNLRRGSKVCDVYLMMVGVSMSLTAQIKFLGKVVEFNKLTNY